MDTTLGGFEIRQARMNIEDRAEFLQTIQSIAQLRSAHIVCFNAENIAGREHAEAAIFSAQRSFFSGRPISNSFEMEALLFASASRQCNTAAIFGIHADENVMFICSCPANELVWEDLSHYMVFVDEKWEEITPEKEERLKVFFGITQEEIAVVGRSRVIELVLERIALLEVNR
jgi:KEOPS complex subunit Cgi121